MQTQGASISFSHVSVTYADGAEHVTACKDVSFTVEPGQAVALIGPSGCGKSTTLHMAAGLLSPSEGDVLVDGDPISQPRQTTAFIPQDLGLLPWKTALQNAALGLVVRKVPKAEALERARAALAQVDMAGFERSYPKELSGGMRQRLALARALAMDADLLLMDEPLSAIDALLRESLQDTLLELWQKRRHTQMLVTHSIEEAVYLGQRIIAFSARPGSVVADVSNPHMGTPDWRDSAAFSEKCQEVRRALTRGAEQAHVPACDSEQMGACASGLRGDGEQTRNPACAPGRTLAPKRDGGQMRDLAGNGVQARDLAGDGKQIKECASGPQGNDNLQVGGVR